MRQTQTEGESSYLLITPRMPTIARIKGKSCRQEAQNSTWVCSTDVTAAFHNQHQQKPGTGSQSQESTPGSLVWDAGISTGSFTMRPNIPPLHSHVSEPSVLLSLGSRTPIMQ